MSAADRVAEFADAHGITLMPWQLHVLEGFLTHGAESSLSAHVTRREVCRHVHVVRGRQTGASQVLAIIDELSTQEER